MAEQGPDPSWIAYQSRMDDDNLRTLVILHRIYAGILGALSCCLGGYFAFIIGLIGVASSSGKPGDAPPPGVFALIFGVWGFVFALIVTKIILNLLAANWLRDRRNYVGIMITSILNCLNMPLGAALGIFTIIVINRPQVKETFR